MKQEWLTIEEKENGELVLKRCAKEAEGEIVIPQGVTEITPGSFEGCYKITSLILPEGLKYIRRPGFSKFDCKGCNNLASITLPESMVFIDGKFFHGCSSLEAISFSPNVKVHGGSFLEETLWYKKQPYEVVYAGSNVIGYKGEMLEGTEIAIKEGTKYITFRAFALQKNLEKVTLPQSVVEIGVEAFQYCENLKTVCIPKNCNIETIGESWLKLDSWHQHDRSLSQLLFQSGLLETEWEYKSNRMSFIRKSCSST